MLFALEISIATQNQRRIGYYSKRHRLMGILIINRPKVLRVVIFYILITI